MNEFIETRPTENPSVIHSFKPGCEKKLFSLLGFASRARKLICGTDLCRDSIRRGTAILTLVAADASANTKKRMTDACKYYESDMCILPFTAAELSHQIGKTGNITVVCLTDVNFANGVSVHFEE